MLATTERDCINHIGETGLATGLQVWLLTVSLRRLRRYDVGVEPDGPDAEP